MDIQGPASTDEGTVDEEEAAEFMTILLGDVRTAEKELRQDSSPYRRRTYVRTTFASVDGFIFTLKRIALTNSHLFTADEIAKLREVRPAQSSSGSSTGRPWFLPTADNLKFAFESFMRFHGSTARIEPDDDWVAFTKAVQIRHRVTHPKSPEDLDLSDADIDIVRGAAHWLAANVMAHVMEAMGVNAFVLLLGVLILWGLAKDPADPTPKDG